MTLRIFDPKDSRVYPLTDDSISRCNIDSVLLYENLKITTIRLNGNVGNNKFGINISKPNGERILYFNRPTGCGITLWHIQIEKNSKKMEIEFQNIDYKIDYLIDSIPFKPGKYFIDISKAQEATFHPRINPSKNQFIFYKIPVLINLYEKKD